MKYRLSIGIPLLFAGLFFGLIPTIVTLLPQTSAVADGGELEIIFIFFIVSFIMLSVSIINISIYLKEKKVHTKGITTTGTFVEMKSNLTVNDTKRFYIVFTYNAGGQTLKQKTGHNFTFAQANYLASLKYFEIKYLNNLAVITEPLDNLVISKNIQTNVSNSNNDLDDCDCTIGHPTPISEVSNDIHDNIDEENYVYMCDYCGHLQKKFGKCKNCGARLHPDSKRIRH